MRGVTLHHESWKELLDDENMDKATTQSTIVSKLSAYARNNRTKRALWEYDNLIQSLYLLNYIDSASLRQNVQRAVNRGESYHQLRRTISYANYGKLRFGTEYEQTPLVGVQPTDRQLHHLLQRHAPLQAARAQGEPGRHARGGLSETGFPCRMATRQSIRTLRIP